MKLYAFPGACALAPHIALEWVGADYDVALIKRADTRKPEFLALNPVGKVPVIEHDDGRVLTQVNAILMWIAGNWPAAQLGPDDDDASKFEMQRWLSHFNGDVHPAFTPYFLTFRYAESDGAQEEVKAAAAKEVDFQLSIIEKHLEGREWMLDDRRSILDAYLAVFCNWARFLPKPLREYSNLSEFAKRIGQDEGFLSAMKQQGLIK